MIDPERLADLLSDAAVLLRTQGGATWQRVDDWEAVRMPRRVEPLSDEQEAQARAGVSELDEDDRREDAAAARYKSELATLTKRLDADLARLARIVSICNPPHPKQIQHRDLLLAQIAADGWCVSCFRNDQHLEPVAEGRYRDRCRPCGDWRGEHGADPPKPILVLRHSGRRITTAAVASVLVPGRGGS